MHVKCEVTANVTYYDTWPATPPGMDPSAARFGVFWEARRTNEPSVINLNNSTEFNYWA